MSERTDQLAESRARLVMADRLASIGALAAGLGHDLANVLLPIRARLHALEVAARRGKIACSEAKHLDAIASGVAYLTQLAESLHHLVSDPESEERAERCAATDIATWWAQVGPLISRSVPPGVAVTTRLPRRARPVAVSAHALTQAILNLVVNAGEAIAARVSRRKGRVRIWAEPAGDDQHVRIGVGDNGCGMSAAVRRRAFEFFFTTKPRGLGTGLGLPLVHTVAVRAGGSVEIASKAGVGTTVVLTLPLARGAAGGPSRVREAFVSIEDGRAGAFVRHLLEASGISVVSAARAQGAEILVADPSRQALQAATRWRSRNKRGRLILLGRPSGRRGEPWRALRPAIINDAHDVAAISAALGPSATPT